MILSKSQYLDEISASSKTARAAKHTKVCASDGIRMGLWCKSCLAKSMAREQSYRNKYVYRIIARLSGMIFLDM